MTDNPQDIPREQRRTGRTGPLGEDSEETSRQETPSSQSSETTSPGDDETRQIPTDQQPATGSEDRTREVSTDEGSAASDDRETRVIRTDGAREEDTLAGQSRRERRESGRTASQDSYPRGYFEAADEREDRLRDIYGGVDALASFFGFVFAVVAGGVLFAVLSLIFVPLGISVSIGSTLGAAAITALVLLAVLVFITFLLGGYVSGRMARFDGGRNGAMCVVWAVIIGVVLFIAGTFLPGGFGENVRNFYQETLIPTFSGLLELGPVGAGVVAGAIIVAILGGIVGGKLGARYHSEIDRTT